MSEAETETGLWKASFVVPVAVAPIYLDALEEGFSPEPLAVSSSELPGGAYWMIEAYYDRAVRRRELAPALDRADRKAQGRHADLQVVSLENRDWVKLSLEGLKPIETRRFFVHGGHDRGRARAPLMPIEIEAAQAFGTGHHATTFSCLQYVEELARVRRPARPLDLGTGSGLLAIALAKLHRVEVIGSDIDPVATRTATENARLNEVGPWCRFVTARGYRHPLLRSSAPYDLIVANILARPLMALAPETARHAAWGGDLVLSGILASQENMVANAFRAQGFRLIDRKPMSEWVTFHMRLG